MSQNPPRSHPSERQMLWGAYLAMLCAERFRTNFAAGRGRLYEEVFERLQELLGDEVRPEPLCGLHR